MGRYLDPCNGFTFNRIFGKHPELTISFLNALMPFEEERHITNIEYLPIEQIRNIPAKEDALIDVRCKDNEGREFIVEIQIHWNNVFSYKLAFNASKVYVKQLNKIEIYEYSLPVYVLCIVDDIFDKETSKYYHHYKTIYYGDSSRAIEDLEFIMIELPKFTSENIEEKGMTTLWLRFLKEIEGEKYIVPAPELMENEYIRQAIALCSMSRFTDAEWDAYENYWDIIRTEKSIIHEGRTEGLAEGLEKGRREGLENVVVKSFENNLSFEIISSITGLSKEDVISILERYKLI
ncbi:MAG: Rpn family recombination-promoting nuclease/putative transposase [Bacteroidales bacterium]|jgi:predicted transposase/invertase (TIGR01784 family)|nr:Rpn family recombination-promoting nuclease/putative transposase [Bacteroidales bacterium]